MSDAVTTARSARESLARGLNALQSDPNVPPHLLELAEPVAQAMGALHQIEKSNGAALVPHAETALSNVRTALAQLQAQPSQHPAVMGAMEAVAGSLGLVHMLTKMAQQQQQPQQQPSFQQPQPSTAFQRPSHDAFGPAPAYVPQQQPFPPQQQQAQRPATGQQPMQQPAFPTGQQPARDPFAQPPQQQAYAPQPMQQPMQQQAQPAPRPMGPPAGDVVSADLGAHSPSNFYKGLAGNDIIDHGGLFVSTYKIPKIGTAVRLKVSLPGGYEFEANAVVRWSREAVDGGSNDAPPGFGAQFTEITPEARQLVYRYVRNREPLFHDDL
jgi:uncharacterized protein (TIGR02266 family)